MKPTQIGKKGQVSTLPNSIVMLGIAAIALVLMMVVLQEMRDSDTLSKELSATVTNETLVTVSETGEDFAHSTLPAVVCTITTVGALNETGVYFNSLSSGNYTQSNCNLVFTGADTQFNDTSWNVSYTSTYGDIAYVQSNETIVGFGTFGDFWTIIVLAIIAGLVIGIIFSAFGGIVGRPR